MMRCPSNSKIRFLPGSHATDGPAGRASLHRIPRRMPAARKTFSFRRNPTTAGTLFRRKERPTGRREIAGQGVQAPEKGEKADAPWPTTAHRRPARLDEAAVVPDRVGRNEYLFRRLANASEPKEGS